MSVKRLSINAALAAVVVAASLSAASAQAKSIDTAKVDCVAHKIVSAKAPLFLVLGVGY